MTNSSTSNANISQSPVMTGAKRVIRLVAIHLAIFIILFGFSLSLVHTAEAQGGLTTKFKTPAECNVKECGWPELIRLGNEVLSFGIYIAVLGAIVVMTMAGWKIVVNNGNEGEVKTGKKMLWAAVVGIIVTMSAYMIIQFILVKLGVINEIRLLI